MNTSEEKLYEKILYLTKNINKYNKEGYRIKYDISDNQLIINYKKSNNYYVKIISDNNTLYWVLEPYDNSYFSTEYNNFDIMLHAIKENEELHKYEQ